MKKNLYSIGEVSKIKNITIKALRYYHRMALIVPAYTDNLTGYRYYSAEQFIHIDIVKGCRVLGTSIQELQDVFKNADMNRLMSLLKSKKKEAEQTIQKMEEIIENVDTLYLSVENSKALVKNEDIHIQDFDERYIVAVTCKEVGEYKELVYYSVLEKFIKANDIKAFQGCGIIYGINCNTDIKPEYVFNFIDKNKNDLKSKNIKKLNAGKYLVINYTKENEDKQREKVLKYLKANHLNITTFIEIDLFDDFFNTEVYSCQMQMYLNPPPIFV